MRKIGLKTWHTITDAKSALEIPKIVSDRQNLRDFLDGRTDISKAVVFLFLI